MSRRRKKRPLTMPARVGQLPIVAVLGRPNVGKSTLFNRLTDRRNAIVEDTPGVTRDRLYLDTDIGDKRFTLVDMGGFEASPDGAVEEGVNRQCLIGLEQAELVLFVVDGRTPPTNGDHDTVKLLRQSGRPCILVINKVDGPSQEAAAGEVFSLGLEPWVMVSALHGRGFGDLEDLIYERLPETPADVDDEEEHVCRVAIIGRPNAGKSSLVNRLLGEDRLLTLAEPGTTRDAVDSYFSREGRQYVLVDTAGIRRKRSVPLRGAEKLAVVSAIRAIERCHVAVLLTDARAGVAEQDAKVLGLATERNRAVVIGLNKWDLMKRDAEAQAEVIERTKDTFTFAPWARWVKVSALTGAGLSQLLDQIDRAFVEFCKRVPTGELNRLFDDIIEHHPPPLRKGRPVKLYYATQASVRPPTFIVQTSYPEALHFSYKRYVQNQIRKVFGFEGTAIRLIFRQRKRRE